MNLLPKLTEVRDRFRVAYPQYWLDKLINEIQSAHKGVDAPVLMGQILAIVRHEEAGEEIIIPGLGFLKNLGYVVGLNTQPFKGVYPGLNIVTTKGDVYYAQLAMTDTITDDFQAAGAGLRMGSATTTPTKANTDVGTFLTGSDHVIDATYPKSNDGDADNTGSGTNVMTWTYSYLTSEGNVSSIAEGGISDVRAGPSTALLTHFLFASVFSKTSSDTLKVIVNHSVLGV